MGAARESNGRAAADGLSVALPARLVQHRASERSALRNHPSCDLSRARAGREARHHRRARAAVAPGIQHRRAQVRAGADRGAEARGVRLGLRWMGAVGAGLAVRHLSPGTGKDLRLEEEGAGGTGYSAKRRLTATAVLY